MRRLLCFLLGIVMLNSQLIAQNNNRTVTGKVVDEKGAPVASASVQVKGANIGTTTSANGTYSVSVPANAKTLVISSVNFESQEISIGNSNVHNVTLRTTESTMQDVVIVGYGTGRKVGTVVGSVATVDADKIKDRPTANAFDALQGKVAGLTVLTSSGEPSQLSSLRLHGVGSLGGSNTPLYVMDGIPIDPGTVISLNPNDFETVSVLKDASATSIYGSRAANGVIYITTKRGSANKPASITLQTQYAISQLANTDFFERLMHRQELQNFFLTSGIRTQAQIDAINAAYPNNDTRWYKYYYLDNQPLFQTDLSISGGSGKTTYYVSGGYLKQEGLAYRSGFKRYTMRSNVATQVNNWFKMGLNLFFGSDKRQTNPYGSNNLNRGLSPLNQPWFSPIDPTTGKEYYGQIPGLGLNAPKYLADKIYNNSNNIQFNPSAFITLTPVKGLTLKSQAGIEAYDFTTTSGTLPSYNNTFSGSSAESFSRGVSRTITNTGEYKFTVANDHNITVLVGQEYIDNETKAFNGGSSGQTDDRLILLGNGTTGFTAGSSKTEYSYLSYFSRLEYNFRNRYFIDGSFRQDKASRFGIDNRTASFWAVGAMWKLKQEPFMQNMDWLTDITLKASYGTQGNSQGIGNYDWQATVSTTNYNGSGWYVSQPGNPELGWESQAKTTIGLDFRVFNRVHADVEFYNRSTSDQLISVPFPYTSGFSAITTNVGSIKNTGIDVTLDADVLKSKKAYITPYVTFNYNKNEITELFQGKEYWVIPNTGVLWAVGQPISYSYPIFYQINPQTGNPEWFLPNAGKTMETRKDPSAVTTAFSAASLEQNTGIKRYPPINGGFGLTAGYAGIFMSADFTFSKGKYMINNDRYFFENPKVFPGYNQFNTVNDFWKQPGDVTRFPRVGVTNWTQFDSRLIEDASFSRLKALTVGYSLPSSILNKTGFIKGTKVYFTGRNLLTWTKYTGPDPEVDSNIGLGTNPNTKQYAFGLDLNF